ncbi:MAG: M48 family metalloprotease, partial [Coriobacteriia bacterium]
VVQMKRSERFLLARLQARPVPHKTIPAVRGALRDMSIAAGFRYPPPLHIIETDRVNAFVLGRTLKRTAIGITRGFVDRLSTDDQRAVFANLLARALSADTLWATAVSALAGPIWAIRDLGFRSQERVMAPEEASRSRGSASADMARVLGPPLVGWIVWYGFVVVVTEFLAYWHQESAWNAAEKADAEGMLLLKDPHEMLAGLENVLERNNHVPTAGDAFSQLFFCWAGFGFAPEQDPEYRRVYRLREVLGVEGLVTPPRPNVPDWPTAPRLGTGPAAYLYDPPVAVPVERGPNGRIALAVVTVLALVAFHSGVVIGDVGYSLMPGLQAFALCAAIVLVGVAWSSYLVAIQGRGGPEVTTFALVAFGVFLLGTLGAGISLVPFWALGAYVGRLRGEAVSREEWRTSFVETVAERGDGPSVVEDERAAMPIERRAVHCKSCGASNAPKNTRCVVCDKRLKP